MTGEVVAVLAAIISVIAAIDVHIQNKKLNKINLKAGYFDTIYKEYLIFIIPKARTYITFLDGKLAGTDKLVNELNNLRRDSLYFFYSDRKFYDGLKNKLQTLEDYLIISQNEYFTSDEQKIVFENIQNDLTKIYDWLLINQFGK